MPVEPFVVETASLAVALVHLEALSSGFVVKLSLRRKADTAPASGNPWTGILAAFDDDREGDRRGPLRLAVEFSDGSTAQPRELSWPEAAERPPERPVISMAGGHGTQTTFELSYWVWPLPPAGPMTFVLNWAAGEVTDVRHSCETDQLLAASRRAVKLW